MAVVLVLATPTGAAAEPTTYAPDESEITQPAPLAERPVCPTPPEPAAEGADPAVVEQRAARIESDEACAATTQRLGELTERLWWIVSEQVRDHAQGVHLLETLGTIEEVGIEQRATLESIRSEVPIELQTIHRDLGAEGVIAERLAAAPEEGTEATEESAEGLEAAIDAGAESTRGALWYLIGAAMGAFVGYFFYRQVMPRA